MWKYGENTITVGEGTDGDAPSLAAAVDIIEALDNWEELDGTGIAGTSPSISVNTNILTWTSGSATDLGIDVWVDLGDGVYHRIEAIIDDDTIIFSDWVYSVPAFDIKFYRPIRRTIIVPPNSNNKGVAQITQPYCLSIVGFSTEGITNSEADATTSVLTTISMTSNIGGEASAVTHGEFNISNIAVDTQNNSLAAFDGAIELHPAGRVHAYFNKVKIRNQHGPDGISCWALGNIFMVNCDIYAGEECFEAIDTDRFVGIANYMQSIRDVSKGDTQSHYNNAMLFAHRDSLTHFHDGLIMASTLLVANNENTAVFHPSGAPEQLNDMANIGILYASKQTNPWSDPTGAVESLFNNITIDIPTGKTGQALRVAHYLSSGTGTMELFSYGDNIRGLGDLTNFDHAYGDRGDVYMYSPVHTPALGTANGGVAKMTRQVATKTGLPAGGGNGNKLVNLSDSKIYYNVLGTWKSAALT